MQKAVFPIQSHADITKAINYMHTNYNQAINEGKPLRVVIDQNQKTGRKHRIGCTGNGFMRFIERQEMTKINCTLSLRRSF